MTQVACNKTPNHEPSDCEKFGQLSLDWLHAAFKDAAIFSLPEAGFGIQSRLEIAARTNPQFTAHPLVKKTVEYTTRFSVNRDPGALEAFRG